jgi:hypothetical protein
MYSLHISLHYKYQLSKSMLLSVVVRISVPASLSPSVIVHSANVTACGFVQLTVRMSLSRGGNATPIK